VKYKWPKPSFFFGGEFGILDFTIFRVHLSCEFSTGGAGGAEMQCRVRPPRSTAAGDADA